MADGADNTPLLIVAAAAVVVAVVWSRRASAATDSGSSDGQMYAGGSARGAELEAESATGFFDGLGRAGKAFGDLFSGLSDLSKKTSSDPNSPIKRTPEERRMEEELRDTLTEGYGDDDVADKAATYSPKAFAFCLEQGEAGTPGAVDDFGNPTEICLMTYDS